MTDRLAALPADAVLVHIGPHKTGTTAIQTTLANSRPQLREFGIHYPGMGAAQHREALALRQFREGWKRDGEPPPDPAVWTRLARRVGNLQGRVVISSEIFAESDDAAREKLVHELGPERVHILAAARNPAGIAVSTWQQIVRTYGSPISLDEWLEKNFRRTEVPESPSGFWGRADSAALISRWAKVVPPDRITVVAVDEQNPRVLPTIFEQLLDLPDGMLADQEPPFTNRGLTSVEAALVRQIIVSLGSRLSWDEYTRTMRKGVIRRLLEVHEPGPDEAKAQMPAWALEQAVVEGERMIERLCGCGVRVAGAVDSLRSVSPGLVRQEASITHVPIEMAAEAVVGAIAIATRDDWSLDSPSAAPAEKAPAPTKGPAQEQTPAAKKQVPNKPTPPNRQPAADDSSPRVDAVPTRELAVIVAKRVNAGVRRRLRRRRR